MLTRDFLDQAVFLTAQFQVVITTCRRLPEAAVQDYWVASRSRFDAWGLQLRQCTNQLEATQFGVDRLWRRWMPLLEEVLVSEIVTRVWAYLLEALDDRLGIQEYSPVGHSAFRAHIDARRRVLNLILRGRPCGLPGVWHLNRQRISAERWTDLLLAQVGERNWLSDYAFDLARVRRFGGLDDRCTRTQPILRAASRSAFTESAEVALANADLHTRMHTAMLGCLGREMFGGDGQLLSDWQARLLMLTDDTQGLLDRWLRDSSMSDLDPDRPDTLHRF
jgi:hypothetical protein